MKPDYQSWRIFFDIFLLLVNGVVGIYVWWTNREKVTTKRFKSLEERLIAVETAVKHPPACPHHNGFENRIDAVHGDVRQLMGQMGGLNRAVDLMNEYLINRGDK